jgi:enoyl-CoA hydratase/carnithine racemase
MTIKTATLNGVATIEIARPEKKNAITQAMYGQLAAAFDAAREDKAVLRAAVRASAQGRQGDCRHGESGCCQVVADRVQRAGAVVHDERGTP